LEGGRESRPLFMALSCPPADPPGAGRASLPSLPTDGGDYALWLELAQARRILVGSLGLVDLPAGDYLYVGSARGAGGLRGRLGRHIQASGPLRWHIDYLRGAAVIRGLIYQVGPWPRECAWCRQLAILAGAWAPVRGFGTSDCRGGCPAHLLALPPGLLPEQMLQALSALG
jgi:Uri superfamily endonuclease